MTEPDVPDAAGVPQPDRPKQPPFPFVLFALCGFAGYSAITTEAGWIKVACFIGALLFAAAAIYQSRQVKPPGQAAGRAVDVGGPVGRGGRPTVMASLNPVGGDPHRLLDLLDVWLAEPGGRLSVRTSGSSGEPKEVVLSREALVASAEATHARLGGPGQWLLALPTTGVAGLQVLVRSAVGGHPPIVVEDHTGLEDALGAMCGARKYASLVPTQLHRLASAGRLDALSTLDALLIGGAAVDPELLAAARDAGVTVVRTYGMSETSGGCVYDGVPLDGVKLRLDDDGQVLVSGPVLFDGYGHESREGDWFATGDLGTIADGVLSIVGRLDDVVQVGGAKVPLPAVEQAVRALPEVHDAAVVAVPDPEWGSRVVAFVVPSDAVCLDALRTESVRETLEAAGLDRWWAPRDVVLVDGVPRLPGGKTDRLRLRQQAATRPSPPRP